MVFKYDQRSFGHSGGNRVNAAKFIFNPNALRMGKVPLIIFEGLLSNAIGLMQPSLSNDN